MPIFDRDLESRGARDNTITLPPEIKGIDAVFDWDAQAAVKLEMSSDG